MTEITLAQAQQAKVELTETIRHALLTFTQKTRLTVDAVGVEYIFTVCDPDLYNIITKEYEPTYRDVYNVSVDVSI
jgi:hypothetical protein